MDHEAKSEDVDGDGEIESPLVVACLSDEEADDEEKHSRDNLESRVDISSLGGVKVDNDLQERGEEVVPGVIRDLVLEALALRGLLTVKLVKGPPDTSKETTASMGLDDCALLESLAQVDLEYKEQRNSDAGQNKSNPTETPSPVLDVDDKSSSSFGAGESSDHVRRRGKGKGQTSVPQVRGIGSENADGVDHASPSDRVEDLGGAEGREVLRDGHEDQAQSGKATHEEEALCTAPDVEGLGHGNVAGCGHGVGHDGDGGH
ncbi:hypothetical protein HG530_004877 [Fusarium avenaceum]|nr:hypothetical protein HG530_004877 [Fusarium avenaceum]